MIISCRIHAVVRTVVQTEDLFASTNVIDFGDCYTGLSSSRTLILRNQSDRRLDIQLGSDGASEIFFELRTELSTADNINSNNMSSAVAAASDVSERSIASNARVDELSLGPGVARTLEVFYAPRQPTIVDERVRFH